MWAKELFIKKNNIATWRTFTSVYITASTAMQCYNNNVSVATTDRLQSSAQIPSSWRRSVIYIDVKLWMYCVCVYVFQIIWRQEVMVSICIGDQSLILILSVGRIAHNSSRVYLQLVSQSQTKLQQVDLQPEPLARHAHCSAKHAHSSWACVILQN